MEEENGMLNGQLGDRPRITVRRIAERFGLENLTPGLDLAARDVRLSEINRPALQLTGYFEHFESERVQAIGNVEYSYLNTLEPAVRSAVLERLFATRIPCLILCRGIELPDAAEVYRMAGRYGVPILRTARGTSDFSADLIRFLGTELAPVVTVHGELVDVFGEGVLICGDSGLGKSETALELIQRGHRLVADDLVEVRKISDAELVGRSPELLRDLIELRGIGILNVRELYGVQSVKPSQPIDMVIRLETADPEKDYRRTGLEEESVEILGNRVVQYSIPLQPGRNIAIIVESAAVNNRQKKLGLSATEDLRARLAENIRRRKAGERPADE